MTLRIEKTSPSKAKKRKGAREPENAPPNKASQDRRRLVLLMVAMVVITIVQVGFFHARYPENQQDIQDHPILSSRPDAPAASNVTISETPDRNSTASKEVLQKPKRPQQTVNSTSTTGKSMATVDRVSAHNSTALSSIRFDVLALQHGPKPQFPPDFDRSGRVIDILQDPSFDLGSLQPLQLDLQTDMLGILIDAGRHYFSVDWLKRLVDVLAVLQYNLIHFRLTDDQAFAIQLESQPKLACPTRYNGNTKVYSPSEIRDFIAYAKKKQISVIPEINVPGHAAAWVGIPGLVIPCRNQACNRGYAIPLNVTHPNFRGILTDVIREVIEIFENPPYLHLGGDEMELAKPCFDEVGADIFDYNDFEGMLQEILRDVGYPEDNVIRWRETSFAPQSARNRKRLKAKKRAGTINHWWHDTPGKTENVTVGTPIIGSARLYMDVNYNEAAWEVFLHSRKWWHLSDVFAQNAPVNLKGIIVGGFELDADFFHDRNVVGRLLAVTIGVSNTPIRNGNQLNELYGQLCRQVGFPDALCRKYGYPTIDWVVFKGKWGAMWSKFKQDICQRFPVPPLPTAARGLPGVAQRVAKPAPDPDQTFDVLALQHGPNPKFPTDFNRAATVIDILQDTSFNLSSLQPLKLELQTNMLGLLVDAGRHYFPLEWLKRLVDVLAALQYNFIHFRLTDDQAFAIQLESHPNLTCPTHLHGNTKVYSRSDIKEWISYARTKNVAIFPEINVPGHAGAWIGIPGLVVPCRSFACRKGYALPLNISHPNLRGILTDVIREVLDVFEDPPYLHLGGDEMELAKGCFDELGAELFDYNDFEGMLQEILEDVGYPEAQVIRWRETSFALQPTKRGKRAGTINHWWHDTPGKTENVTAGTPIIGSARLYMDVNVDEAAWEVFLHSRKWWHLDEIFAQNAPVNLEGIIVGGFELDAGFFHDRNVVGRLLAVTIGVSNLPILSGNQLNTIYAELCLQVRLPEALCRKYGRPILDWGSFKASWSSVWKEWKQDVCQRFPKPVSSDARLLPGQQRSRTAIIANDVRIQKATAPSTRHNQTFDVLALQYGPDPKFPSDFDRNGRVIDILQDTTFNLSTLKPLDLQLETSMLGILVDAGRHYFPLQWLKRLIDVLTVLQYNLIHLRLTDDQAFAIQLESQPALACPTRINGNTQVYSREDIRELISYARSKNIAIIPEINVPGHAGAWTGIPGLVIPCRNQACNRGYAIPLNVTHPNFRDILTDVIREVIETFENPPYLHLGGDEMELAKPCFDEVGADIFDYNDFEGMLQEILRDVGYPEDNVIRWRETSFAPQSARNRKRLKAKKRAGTINHWWHDTPGKTENVTVGTPIIGSARLYMDVNYNEAAWEVFLHSRKWWHLSDVFAQNAPVNLKGIIVGGFELDADFFHDRNVVGRLLAVTIGVSNTPIRNGNQLNELYGQLCRQVGFPDALCRKYGYPTIDWVVFKGKWGAMWSKFKQDICQRFPVRFNKKTSISLGS